MSDMKTAVVNIMREVLELKGELPDAEMTMDAIDGWDSLSHLELMAALEERFDIELDVDEMIEMTDLASIVRMVGARMA